MKSVILSCPTLKGELLAALAKNNADISVVFLPKELHRDPKYLHQFVQKTIDEIKGVVYIKDILLFKSTMLSSNFPSPQI